MMGTKPEIRGTVTGQMYCDLPDGHRTTFVVGMVDMLGFAYLYAAPEHKPRIDAMLNYSGGRENDALRKRFDTYMSEREDRKTFGAASCFFTALNEWCEFDEKKVPSNFSLRGIWRRLKN